ncbi:hypothetical protein GCM10008960_03270 [Deinococcus sedimenti]|uniref:Uncharacterized protein n=1 Tax=Deinococcus sedimenti TaxID=1867090 RepID=A0ABQ2RY32_9DEIO|nr:hypothetical protein GCM10008960_03270 [Deinococcus sedimenti]
MHEVRQTVMGTGQHLNAVETAINESEHQIVALKVRHTLPGSHRTERYPKPLQHMLYPIIRTQGEFLSGREQCSEGNGVEARYPSMLGTAPRVVIRALADAGFSPRSVSGRRG